MCAICLNTYSKFICEILFNTDYEPGVVQDTKMGKTFYFTSRNVVRNEEHLQMGLLGKNCFSLQN